MSTVEKIYRRLEKIIKDNNPNANLSRIQAAFEYARENHGSQMRKDGTEYITHPIASAEIAAEIGLDEDSLCAALLHDCIEDTGVTHTDIKKRFGSEVADIVEGVTKLSRVTYTSKEEEQMENMRKMLMAMSKDIRVILIKIADRLHNMRTMEYQSQKKQSEKALETMEIYAPIAHRLGMQKIKWELEDLSIMYLDPIGYKEIQEGLKMRHGKDESFFDNIQTKISERLSAHGIECVVNGRIKHIYSIYRKMYSLNKPLSEVLDLYAFRVIVDDISDCYSVLGHVHDMFRPLPDRVKDYISTPKPNMYQSLHTSVIGGEGIPFEIQIRTWSMHHTAEYGIAAHWKYKEGKMGQVIGEEEFTWVRRLLESQQDSDPQEFFHDLKVDMFADEVYVFTPSGDVVSLPAGATPIDFAYSIHSEVGNKMVGASVNNKHVPFNHILSSGDKVEIITSKSAKGPSRDWLKIIKSTEARNKIRQWFKREKREDNIHHGKLAFESDLRHANLTLSDVLNDDNFKRILKQTSLLTLDDLFASIGYGGLSAKKIVNKIREDIRIAEKAKRREELNKREPPAAPTERVKPAHGIIVEGVDNCMVKYARCCAPVPGDAVTGFITRGFGVSVHRQDCVNYIKSVQDPKNSERWVKVLWEEADDAVYTASILISVVERRGVVVDIATILNALKIKFSSFAAKDAGDGIISVAVEIDVKNRGELSAAMTKLKSVEGVTSVRRVG